MIWDQQYLTAIHRQKKWSLKEGSSGGRPRVNHLSESRRPLSQGLHRVKMLHSLKYDVEFIHLATQIAKHVIVQYLNIH